MAHDTWRSIAVPILNNFASKENPESEIITIGKLAEVVDSDAASVADEVERLIRGGYMTGNLRKLLTGGDPSPWPLVGAKLLERGARVVGMWPPEELYQAILSILDQVEQISDQPTRTSLQNLRSAFLNLGANTSAAVLAALISSHV